jgi:hypothetical protein
MEGRVDLDRHKALCVAIEMATDRGNNVACCIGIVRPASPMHHCFGINGHTAALRRDLREVLENAPRQ